LRATAFAANGLASLLENTLAGKLRQSCGFESIVPVAQGKTDVVVDLNIVSTARGSTGGSSTTRARRRSIRCSC